MHRLLKKINGLNKSFIWHYIQDSPEYNFLPHLIYFIKNKNRWTNSENILQRIYAEVPGDSEEAWEVWRHFRSAQAEITSVFLIENYFAGKVIELEGSRPGVGKKCDISMAFNSDADYFLEVKAQSGQQHGNKHPISDGLIQFNPQFEDDLYSWLFEERISSRNGQPMRPYCLQASEKQADVLVAMTDIFLQRSNNMNSSAKVVIPDYLEVCNKDFRRYYLNVFSLQNVINAILQWLRIKTDFIGVIAITAGEETTKKMGSLKEIWIFDNSALEDMIIVQRAEHQLSILAMSDA